MRRNLTPTGRAAYRRGVVCLDVPVAPGGCPADGNERLLTLTHDPRRGITCWDENALAEGRRYQQLSPIAGLMALRPAAQAWARDRHSGPG